MSEVTDKAVVVHGDARGTSAPTSAREVTALLRHAVDKECDADTLERLVTLHERITARAAATEFAEGLAAFQHECPPIERKSEAKIVKSSGGSFTYTYADLEEIVRVVRPLLYARGFSFTWDSEVRERLMVCTCKLRHVNGHSEQASFAAPVESKAGLSEPQKYSSALSYAKRISLVQVLGITTTEPDKPEDEPIAPSQVAELEALAREVNADMTKFLRFLGVDALMDIRQSQFKNAKNALASKGRK